MSVRTNPTRCDTSEFRSSIQALASGSGETASSAVAEAQLRLACQPMLMLYVFPTFHRKEMDAFAKHKHHFALPTLPAPVALCELPAAAHCTVLEDFLFDSRSAFCCDSRIY